MKLKSKMKKILYIVLLVLVLSGCSEGAKHGNQMLQIDEREGYIEVRVMDPWKKGRVLHTYLLVERDRELPDGLPEGTIVRTPLRSVLVYSDVHARAIAELGSVSSVSSVCDARYFKTPEIVAGLRNGGVTDCGDSHSPSVERIVSVSPEAIILSPFENGGYGALENMGIPIIEMADYMESSPLERARWIEFLGCLFGRQKEAAAIYRRVEADYKSLCRLVEQTDEKRPTVISETVTGGVWYIPGGKSYKATLYKDAGADYPWSDDMSAGSLSLDFPQVLDKAQKADFWLVTTYGQELDGSVLKGIYAHNDQFEAFSNGGVFFFDSQKSGLFEETPFHPERLLKEYVKLFHPQLLPDYELRYYKKMTE